MLAASGADLATILNGSFEDPTALGGEQEFESGDNLGGWDVTLGSATLLDSSEVPADDGEQSVTLIGVIQQEITDMIVGETYKLSFSIGINPIVGLASANLQLDFGNAASGQFFQVLQKPLREDPNWRTEEVEFIADTTSETLSFFGRTATSQSGIMLDDVQLTRMGAPMDGDVGVVPLPAAGWLMIGALGGLAAMRRRSQGRG